MLSDSHSRIEVYVQRNKRNNSFEVQTVTIRLYLVCDIVGIDWGHFSSVYCAVNAIHFNATRVIWLCERSKRYVQLIILIRAKYNNYQNFFVTVSRGNRRFTYRSEWKLTGRKYMYKIKSRIRERGQLWLND